jgi:dTDP-4-amino-4,6-dideoxygalactose transaminase
MSTTAHEKLALLGGGKAVTADVASVSRWPIIGEEEIAAVTDLMRKGEVSTSPIVKEFEAEFADYVGARYALCCNNGTATLHSAVFAAGVGPGDEVILPSYTWWATAVPIIAGNGIPVFADANPDTYTLDPEDVERRITPQTRPIIVTHVWGNPGDMDALMRIAQRHNLVVIEDASHAHGAELGGKKTGNLGHLGCFSLQGSKPMVAGEGGILTTNDRELYERCVALAHYERIPGLETDQYKKYLWTGMGWKYRIHPLAAAMARVQLRKLDHYNAIKRRNTDRFDAGIAGLPGIKPQRALPAARRVYFEYRLTYDPARFGGVAKERLLEALRAEGVGCADERYGLLHLEPLFQEQDLYGKGCPWKCPHAKRAVTYRRGDLPVSEDLHARVFSVTLFSHPADEVVDQYIQAFRKVILNLDQLRR